MIKLTSKDITLTGLFITLGVTLPLVFHQVALSGRIFSPMHVPVFLAGIFVGPVSGLIVGLVCPLLSFLLTGMPPPYAVPLMSLELPVLILGRLAFALGLFVFGLFLSLPYGPEAFIKVSVITGLPGIALQLILIPLLVEAVQLARR
jgi:predicted membrane protein